MSFISEYIQKKISTESSKKNLSFLDDLEENIILDDDEEANRKPIKEQLSDVSSYTAAALDKGTYYISNFWKKLYILESTDYASGKKLFGKIRWENKESANENAKKMYGLKYSPDSLRVVEVAKDRTLDKVISNPTFFLNKKVNKMELGEFFIEYASLLDDGLTKKEAVQELRKTIKDKTLRDFLWELEDSSFKMSQLMLREGAFDEYTISIVQSSEATGWSKDFYEGLTKLGESYVAEETFRRSFIKSLYYPGILIASVILIGLGSIKFLIPALSGIFDEITGGNLPGIMVLLLQIESKLGLYLIQIFLFIVFVYIAKKVLFTNKQLMIRYELYKLKIPIIGNVLRLVEENRVLSILIQTIQAQITPQQKIQFFQKASKSTLYNKVYQYMYNEYPNKQNLVGTMKEANDSFGERLFSDRFLFVLDKAGNETEKRLKKYKVYLGKNQIVVKKIMDGLKTWILTMASIIIAISIVSLLLLMFSVVLSAVG